MPRRAFSPKGRMAWNAFTADDALEALSDAELTAVNNFAGREKLPGVVATQVAAFRGAIGIRQETGPEGTVPDSVRHHVAAAAIGRFLLGVPGVLMTAERKEAVKRAEEALEQLGRGELRVEAPDGSGVSRPTMKTLGADDRRATAAKLNGLT